MSQKRDMGHPADRGELVSQFDVLKDWNYERYSEIYRD